MKARVGDWIETYSGKMFYPLDPLPEEVHLIDIAHGSSMMCRFNGQCKTFLSVGQHAINVSKEVERLTSDWPEIMSVKAQALAMLHDASEVLGLADICSPAKRFMPEYLAIEEDVQKAVWEAFGLNHSESEYEIVNKVDKAMAAYEAQYLMRCIHWDINSSYLVQEDSSNLRHIDLSIRNMQDVENEFYDRTSRLLIKLQGAFK